MRPFEYRVLGYARSDLDVTCIDFAVVVRLSDISIGSVFSFILDGWKNIIGPENQDQVEYIEDFLHDLRQQSVSDRDESDGLFQSIEGLSIGPMRTVLSGKVDANQAGLLLDGLLKSSDRLQVCPTEAFESILAEIRLAEAMRVAEHCLTSSRLPQALADALRAHSDIT